jgi:hypothetical protein
VRGGGHNAAFGIIYAFGYLRQFLLKDISRPYCGGRTCITWVVFLDQGVIR